MIQTMGRLTESRDDEQATPLPVSANYALSVMIFLTLRRSILSSWAMER